MPQKSFITIPELHVDRRVMDGFRRRAWKAYPNEYLEYFWGWREENRLYVVVSVGIEHKAGKDWIEADEEEVEEIINKGSREHKLHPVGSIHTHPVSGKDPKWLEEVNRHLSRCDHEESYRAGELISAVTSMWVANGRKHSATHWWVPQGSIRPVSQSHPAKPSQKPE